MKKEYGSRFGVIIKKCPGLDEFWHAGKGVIACLCNNHDPRVKPTGKDWERSTYIRARPTPENDYVRPLRENIFFIGHSGEFEGSLEEAKVEADKIVLHCQEDVYYFVDCGYDITKRIDIYGDEYVCLTDYRGEEARFERPITPGEDVRIKDSNGDTVFCRRWFGFPLPEDDPDITDPIDFGDFGFYGDWVNCTIAAENQRPTANGLIVAALERGDYKIDRREFCQCGFVWGSDGTGDLTCKAYGEARNNLNEWCWIENVLVINGNDIVVCDALFGLQVLISDADGVIFKKLQKRGIANTMMAGLDAPNSVHDARMREALVEWVHDYADYWAELYLRKGNPTITTHYYNEE